MAFAVPVVRIQHLDKHIGADTLAITTADGCPCITRIGDFSEGELAVYIPVESVIPENSPWVQEHLSFLKFKNGTHRVKAMRLRGVFSMGVLLPLYKVMPALLAHSGKVDVQEGLDLAEALGISKYEEPEDSSNMSLGNSDMERDPGLLPVYDMESFRRFSDIFTPGEEVVVTEKLHGSNARFIHDGTRLWVGSHRTFRKLDGNSIWNRIAKEYDLESKLSAFPLVGVYGETYGDIQDLKYGCQKGEIKFAVFDVYDNSNRVPKFMDYKGALSFCLDLDLPTVPVMYAGPFSREAVEKAASGPSTFAAHIREGVVVKAATEGFDRRTGRRQLKLVSEEYLLRKNGTERH